MSTYLSLIQTTGNFLSEYISPYNDSNLASVIESVPHITEIELGIFTSFTAILDQLTLKDDIVIETEIASSSETEVENISEPEVTTPQNLAEAIVSIYCTIKTRKYEMRISGTGFFIDDRGVVMTNAHVAQFLLLKGIKDYSNEKCVIRSGKEASPTYEVSLLYISPTWLIANAEKITSENPTGTGEDDFALLYVTKRIDDEPVDSFPYLNTDTNLLTPKTKGQTVILSGYPKFGDGSDNDGAVRFVATSSVAALYTFGSSTVDVLALTGTQLGAQGVSGGPVIDHNGNVIGVISTRASDSRFGNGSLKAISLAYINNKIKEETGYDLKSSLIGDLTTRANIFNDTITPILTGILADQL